MELELALDVAILDMIEAPLALVECIVLEVKILVFHFIGFAKLRTTKYL